MVKGNHCQVSATAIAHKAVSARVMSERSGMSSASSSRCIGLTSGV